MLKRDEPIRFLVFLAVCLHFSIEKTVRQKCEPITVKLCSNMPYNYTRLPNSMNHDSQAEIDKILSDYDQLLQTRCSENLQKFLCSLFVPICLGDEFIPPCKDLCVDSKQKCEKHMLEVGYSWPENIECSQFPTRDQEKYVCVSSETDYNVTDPDSTELLFTFKEIDSKEVEVDTTFKEPIIILLCTRHQILSYNVPIQDLFTLHTGIDKGASVDFHYRKQYIFWAGVEEGRIHRATLNLEVLRDIRIFAESVQAYIEGIAVDWITDHVFWLESYPASLKVSSLDGDSPTNLYDFGNDNYITLPRFPVIDPIAGYLFWVEMEGDIYTPSVSIERFNIRTKSKKTIYNISEDNIHNMGRPTALTLELNSKRIYWTDASSESIQSTDYNGNQFRMLVTSQRYLSEPLALSVYKNNIFWSDGAERSIGKTNTDNGLRPSFIETLTASAAVDLKVFHKDVQPIGIAPYKIVLISRAPVSHGNFSLSFTTALILTLYLLL